MVNIILNKSPNITFSAKYRRFRDLENVGQCNDSYEYSYIRDGAIRWQIHDFMSDGNDNVSFFQPLLGRIATWKI